MKKLALIFFVGLCSRNSHAQFSSGSSFYIPGGTTVSINGLVVKPTLGFVELNDVKITLSSEPIAGTPTGSINRVYTLNKPLNVLGDVGIKYLPSELNGNTESMLELAYYNETDRYVTTAGSVQTPAQDLVMHSFNLSTMSDMQKITAVDGKSALPVVLVAFTAERFEDHVAIKWNTATEVNSDHFEVHRSQNGHEWKPLAKVKSNVESKKMKEYHYLDKEPLSGINLYRLKMVDMDGTYSFSKMISVEFDGVETVNVYPNPVVDMLSIKRRDWSDILAIKIYNPAGQILNISDCSDNSNPMVREYDLSGLASGIYVVKTIDKKGLVSINKVAKQ
jgi:hypothetical protein